MTPDTLHVERDGAECYVTASNALERLCTMSRPTARQRLADAKMIVHRCNLHEELFEALKAAQTLLCYRTHSDFWCDEVEPVAKQIADTIAKAERGQP